jgi:hypothetical protein
MGEIGLPYGTPVSTSEKSPICPLMARRIRRSSRKLLVQLIILYGRLRESITWSKRPLAT